MRSPSIVCVSMIARSSGVSAPGLLMISFGIRTLPTSWRSAANSMSRRSRAPMPELVRDRERQVDDVAAVRAGVRVVGLDHVAEQEHGAAVGVAQLELGIDPHAALPREHREQADQRKGEHDREGRVHGRERNGEPDRREARVDGVNPGHRAQLHLRRDAEHGPLAHGGAGEVERELREERGQRRPATGRATASLRRRGRARAPARRRATHCRRGGTRGRRGAVRAARPRSRRARSPPRPRAAPSRSAGRTASARGSAASGRPSRFRPRSRGGTRSRRR